jgi:hypothetical protein
MTGNSNYARRNNKNYKELVNVVFVKFIIGNFGYWQK